MAGAPPHRAGRTGYEPVALCREGMTILMVMHELAIMDEFCDPVAAMAEGRLLAEGTMAETAAPQARGWSLPCRPTWPRAGLPLRARGITPATAPDPVIQGR